MNSILQVLNLIGGLGVFLIGMRIMSDGIQKRAGNRLKSVLHTMTENRFGGVLTGIGVTSIIQSSSATTVILVSLVNAGLVTLKQSIGVIMGANIGTTLTAWIISIVGFKFKITSVALPAVAIAIPFYFSSRTKRKEIADILIGFGLLFLGLSFMKEAVPDIKNNPEVLAFLSNWSQWGFGSVLLFVFIGTILTIVVQSSSAAMTITLTMAFKGWISFPVAAAVVLGENIGTTITAFIASLPMNATAKRTARAHMVFNLIGVAWMLAVFTPFTRFIDSMISGTATAELPIQLSIFHTLFNIINTVLLLGFISPLTKVVEKMIKDDPSTVKKEDYQLKLVPGNLDDAVDANLITIRAQLAEMAGIAYGMLNNVMKNPQDAKRFKEVKDLLTADENRVDDMQEQMISYLTKCTRRPLGRDQSKTVASQRRITNEIESIADSTYGIGLLMERLYTKGLSFHEQGDNELMEYTSRVLKFLKYNQDFLGYRLEDYNLEIALEMENGIDKMRDQLRKHSRKTIEHETDVDVKGELIFMDIVRHLEHIGDSSLNVSEAIAELPELS